MLLVEDDVNDARLTTRYLARWKHPLEVHVSVDLDQAVEHLKENPQVSLILLDYNLPGYSGLDLLASIRTNGLARNIPVVVLTGNSDGRVVERAREAGANSCVLKPIDPADYEQTVSAIADFWLGANLTVRWDERTSVL